MWCAMCAWLVHDRCICVCVCVHGWCICGVRCDAWLDARKSAYVVCDVCMVGALIGAYVVMRLLMHGWLTFGAPYIHD